MPELISRLALIALVACSAVSTDLYLSGIPGLISELGASHADGQLTLSLFMVGFAFGQLLFGPLSDYYGRIPVVTAGLALYCIASLGCAIAPGMNLLLAARLVQGLGAASGPGIARAIVRDRYQARDAARVMAQLAAAMAVVPLVAPVISAVLVVRVFMSPSCAHHSQCLADGVGNLLIFFLDYEFLDDRIHEHDLNRRYTAFAFLDTGQQLLADDRLQIKGKSLADGMVHICWEQVENTTKSGRTG